MRLLGHRLLILAAFAAPVAEAQRSASIDALRSATVFIRVQTDSGEASGSGLVVTSTGVIATAAHVMHGARQARVKLSSGEEYDVVGILDSDERLDVALIAIAGFGLPIAHLGNSDSVQAGDRLIAVGAPLGLQGTIADGLLSAIRFKDGIRQFQISIPVSHGSSGGPVATADGRVIGLVVSGIRGGGAENLNFAIPFNYVRGKLGFISGKAPTALGGSGSSADAFSDTPRNVPRRVNDSLKVDWASLDGVQYLVEFADDKGFHSFMSTRYSATPNPDGVLTVERVDATRIKKASGFRIVDVADDVRRTLYTAGRENDFVSTLHRLPYISDVPAMDSKLTVRGSQFTLVEAGKPDRRGAAAPGVLPADFIGALIAAYPGELPDKLLFWILDPDSDRPVAARFEAIRKETRRVPLATDVAGCSGDSPKIHGKDMAVVVAAMTTGVNRVESTYLARGPHLAVAKEIKCVRIP